MNRLKCIVLTMLMFSGISLIAGMETELKEFHDYATTLTKYTDKTISNTADSELTRLSYDIETPHTTRNEAVAKKIISNAKQLSAAQLAQFCKDLSACYKFIVIWKNEAVLQKILAKYKGPNPGILPCNGTQSAVQHANDDPIKNSILNLAVVDQHIKDLSKIKGVTAKRNVPVILLSIPGLLTVELSYNVAGGTPSSTAQAPSTAKPTPAPTATKPTPTSKEPGKITLINWSQNYTISIQLPGGGTWNHLRPRTRHQIIAKAPKTLELRACEKTNAQCDSAQAKGTFSVTYKDTSNDIAPDKTVLIFDAGNSFFKGLSTSSTTTSTARILTRVQKMSASKDIRVLPVSPAEPLYINTIDRVIKK